VWLNNTLASGGKADLGIGLPLNRQTDR
jgi:hypothetical protein